MRLSRENDAEQFEQSLQLAEQGQPVSESMAGLVEVAGTVKTLSAQPPPPPYRLAPGRQRFLAEAAGVKAGKARRQPGKLAGPVFRLAAAVLAVVLVLGAVAGTGQVAAGSLPGDPLYGLKLTTEKARITITKSPEAQASLNLTLAEVRLAEVTTLVDQGQVVDKATVTRTTQQLDAALEAANAVEAPLWREELATSLQQRQRTMAAAAGDAPEPPVQLLLREMERVRQEAHAGAGEPGGEPDRLRLGTPPPEPSGMPKPTGQTAPRHTGQPEDGHQQGPSAEPGPSVSPTHTPTSPPTGAPTDRPRGTPTDQPGSTPGGTPVGPQPKPTQTPGPGSAQTPEPGPSQPPGPGPSQTPGPGPSEPPGDGPGDGSPPPQGGSPPQGDDSGGDKGKGP